MRFKLIFLSINFFLFSSFPNYGKEYKGAEYRTLETFIYGRFEVSYKPANREGVVSSFFTYHDFTNETGWNEIDLESIGRYSNSIQFNTITPGQRFHIRSQHINFDPYIDFHIYAFEWTPDYVAWFIDGEEVFRQTGEHIKTLEYPQKIMMNIWNPIYTNWVGYFQKEYLPAVSIYDWVQYSSYTPGSGNYGTDNNFTIQWKDDFNDFDSTRWSKASHTFGGNLADFIPENIIFKDGNLHLYLTLEQDIEGIDNTPPKIVWSRANYDSSISLKFSEEITNESALNISNYILPGGKISSIEVSNNYLYAKLFTKNFNPYVLNNLLYSGLVDQSYNANTSPISVSTISKLDSINFPIKVNVGGDAYNDYLADQEWNSNVRYGYWMGDVKEYPEGLDIQGTEDDYIFRSERKGIISYKFKIPNGDYKIKFLFSDNMNDSPGKTKFNIFAEDSLIQRDIDVFSIVGKNSLYQIEAIISVQDGILDIHFEESIDSAFINAIIVENILTNVDNLNESIQIDQFKLYQNYPNPFNGSTLINYYLPKTSDVELKIYNVLGRLILAEKKPLQQKGIYQYYWNSLTSEGKQINSGIYIYQIIAGEFTEAKKMIYLK